MFKGLKLSIVNYFLKTKGVEKEDNYKIKNKLRLWKKHTENLRLIRFSFGFKKLLYFTLFGIKNINYFSRDNINKNEKIQIKENSKKFLVEVENNNKFIKFNNLKHIENSSNPSSTVNLSPNKNIKNYENPFRNNEEIKLNDISNFYSIILSDKKRNDVEINIKCSSNNEDNRKNDSISNEAINNLHSPEFFILCHSYDEIKFNNKNEYDYFNI